MTSENPPSRGVTTNVLPSSNDAVNRPPAPLESLPNEQALQRGLQWRVRVHAEHRDARSRAHKHVITIPPPRRGRLRSIQPAQLLLAGSSPTGVCESSRPIHAPSPGPRSPEVQRRRPVRLPAHPSLRVQDHGRPGRRVGQEAIDCRGPPGRLHLRNPVGAGDIGKPQLTLDWRGRRGRRHTPQVRERIQPPGRRHSPARPQPLVHRRVPLHRRKPRQVAVQVVLHRPRRHIEREVVILQRVHQLVRQRFQLPRGKLVKPGAPPASPHTACPPPGRTAR